jgi:hypothetical protein
MSNERQTRAAMQFLGWVQKFHPEMAASIIERVGEAPPSGGLNGLAGSWDMFYPSMFYGNAGYRDRYHSDGEHLSGLGADTWSVTSTETAQSSNGFFDWAKEVVSVAKEVVPAYLAYDAQKDIMDLNMERARNGQEPIDPGVVAPQVRVIHDLPPETQSLIQQFKTGGMNILLWGALAIGGFFIIRKMT